MKHLYYCLATITLLTAFCSSSKKTNLNAMVPGLPRKLVWAEEFNYTGPPDSTKWSYESGFIRNDEEQYYTSHRLENCRVENGMLVIEARKERWPNAAWKPGGSGASKDSVAKYTSASINTLGKQTWLYGRIEVRAKVPSGKGTWPAIWMLGENYHEVNWPKCGEIDIMEFLGKDPTTIYGTVHAPDTIKDGHKSIGGTAVTKNASDSFHIYAIEWDKKEIAFYFDEKKYFVYDIKNSQHTGDNPFQKKCYLLLNLALGHPGAWPGPLEESILPIKYYVDYVRVYQ